MSNIKKQCERVSSTFFTVIEKDLLAAAYMLGNLYYFLPTVHGEEKARIEKTLKKVNEKLTKKQIQNLWHAIDKLKSSDWNTMDKGNKRSLDALKRQMIREIEYFQHIEVDALVKAGQDINLCREVLIALIQKHLTSKHEQNPFKGNKLDYELLSKGGTEQNHRYLFNFMNKCASLPLENIVLLCQKDIKIAELVILEFSTTQHHFMVSSKLAEHHPKLRPSVAKNWQKCTATYPTTPKQEMVIEETKKKQPEFANVKTNTRAERTQPRGENEVEIPAWQHVAGGVTGAGISYVAVSATVCTCACPPLLPLYFLGVGLGTGLVATTSSMKPTVDRWERSARKKLCNLIGWK